MVFTWRCCFDCFQIFSQCSFCNFSLCLHLQHKLEGAALIVFISLANAHFAIFISVHTSLGQSCFKPSIWESSCMQPTVYLILNRFDTMHKIHMEVLIWQDKNANLCATVGVAIFHCVCVSFIFFVQMFVSYVFHLSLQLNTMFYYFCFRLWQKKASFNLIVLTLKGCFSLGDAMRDIDNRSLLRSDFLLLFGDLVTNLKLDELIEVHK